MYALNWHRWLSIWILCKYMKNKARNIVFQFLSFLGSPVILHNLKVCRDQKTRHLLDIKSLNGHSSLNFDVNTAKNVQWSYISWKSRKKRLETHLELIQTCIVYVFICCPVLQGCQEDKRLMEKLQKLVEELVPPSK